MAESVTKLLLVDDDPRLSSLLKRYLEENQCLVTAVGDAKQMDNKLLQQHFDLLILDLMLPGEDGLTICSRLRASGQNIPIIMLTAKGDDIDRIIGLEIGADDYMAKPCNPRELVARIRALLRRQQRPISAQEFNEEVFSFGSFSLHVNKHELHTVEQIIALTSSEFAFLHALVTHPHQPLSRERLMILARGKDHDVFDRSIDVQISRLRKLLADDPKKPKLIQTVWGVGYVFIPPEVST
ncbi:MAG: two-component system, OmpR family, phosphate regulon response regulator OmpR [Methyloprofundus sp.]|nr:MAG: two-component system, OmpR family, phosphate regulon response regulator OmpR [Methyloprofundus sp.]